MTIIGLDGKPVNPEQRLDPKKTGIEELISILQSDKADELDMNDTVTIIISELARTKALLIRTTDIIKDQDEIIKRLNNGKGALA